MSTQNKNGKDADPEANATRWWTVTAAAVRNELKNYIFTAVQWVLLDKEMFCSLGDVNNSWKQYSNKWVDTNGISSESCIYL